MTRHVAGPTDRVVVVGAGLAGLSAALRLAGAGRQVVVCESGPGPGGRAGVLQRDGYTFDTGPTVLTMPGLIADALACVGEKLEDWLDLLPLDPVYRAHFPDGSTLDVLSDPDRMADQVAEVCGPAEAAGYRRFVAYLARLYRAEFTTFIDRNLDSPLDLLRPDLARVAALGGFRRLAPKVAQFFDDPRTQRVFSFQALYAGVSPQRALALYAVITYLDSVAGVYFPRGGITAVPHALAGAAAKHGVDLRYETPVSKVEFTHGRASGVRCVDGTRIPADVVVVTADLPTAYADLLPPTAAPRRLQSTRYSPSCMLLLHGSTASYRGIAHHNIHFGRAWKQTFADLDRGRLMRDPSILVTNPTRTDPTLAPAGRQSYYVLVPTPNLEQAPDIHWPTLTAPYRAEILRRLEDVGYRGYGDAVEVEDITTPADWAARGMAGGAPFAAAHTFRQTGPFRAGNLPRNLPGLVFAGSGTTPGVGVPMVLLSGRLAAERILGPTA